MPASPSPQAYIFGAYRFDVSGRRLLRDGQVVPLTPKVLDALALLLENRDRVISKEELIGALWPDSFVEDASLSQAVYALRKGLGEGYVETLPRRGYRFAADVTTIEADATTRTLAVLPFQPLAERRRDESLELGLADALITTLGNSGLLTVRPISATRRYANVERDPIAAGRELGVDAVLDGTIQRSDERLRVTARLMRTSDAATLWAGRFHETFTSIFDVQDAIADRITAALELKLAGADRARVHKRYTGNSEAHRLYLSGRYNFSKGTEEGLRRAIDFFYEAIALDPQYALAYVGVADAYIFLDWYGVLSTRESNPQAFAAAGKALALDPELAEAHASMGLALQYRWDWTAAEASFRHSIALNPNYAAARQWFAAHLAFRGRTSEALAEIRKAQELDPMSLAIRAQYALILYCARRFDEAIGHCRAALRVEPEHDEARIYLALSLMETGSPDAAVIELRRTTITETPDVQAMLARACARAGQPGEARELLKRLIAGSEGSRYIPHLWIAAAQLALGDRDAALRQLDAAYRDPDDSCAGIGATPLFDPLRGDPRFEALLNRMGLAGSA